LQSTRKCWWNRHAITLPSSPTTFIHSSARYSDHRGRQAVREGGRGAAR
jgi:hypothetical protein